MKTAIINGKILLPDEIIWNGVVLFENGEITDVGSSEKISIPRDADVIDAKGLYVAPGLIDIHNHGVGENLFVDNPLACAEELISHGVTTVLPTLYTNLSKEQMIEGASKISKASKTGLGRIIDGLYMEGPYMCAGLGSFKNQLKWQDGIEKKDYIPLIDGIGKMVRVWAVDPARDGIEIFMQDCKKYDEKVIFALGHSYASAKDCKKVKKYGVKVQTHHSDSGKAKGYAQCTIGAGCDEYTLYDPDIYAELICDQNGIHVVPDLIKMVIRTKGVERIILISDSMPKNNDYKNNEQEGIGYGPDLNYDDMGHLAGSRLFLDDAVKNVMAHTGYGLCHAIRFATYNPASMLGIDDKVGSLEKGKLANIILIDDTVEVKKVIFNGESVFEKN